MKKIMFISFFLLTTIMLMSEAIVFNMDTLNFGEVTINETNTQTITVTSQINQTINLSSDDGAFTFTPTSFTLAVGANQAVEVTFTPTEEESYSATLTATGSVFGSDTTSLVGTGIVANIQVSISEYDFGPVTINSTETSSVNLTNTGSGNLVGSITSDNSHFQTSITEFSIAPGDSDSFLISFTPDTIPEETATISITSNAMSSPSLQISVTGSGKSEISGQVSGTWSAANSPYFIIEDTIIPDGQTLTIEPGVEVVFSGNYGFIVQGSLFAQGTENDSIYFHGQDDVNLGYIIIDEADNEIDFNHCKFEYLLTNDYYFTDGFESNNFAENWTGEGYSYGRTSYEKHTGNYGLRIESYNQDTYITSLPITVVKPCKISYWFKVTISDYYCKTLVRYRVNNGSWLTLFQTNDHTTYDWTYKEHDISSNVNSGDQIELRFYGDIYSTNNERNYQVFYIDDVKVGSVNDSYSFGKSMYIKNTNVNFTDTYIANNRGKTIYFAGDTNCSLTNTIIQGNNGTTLTYSGPLTITNSIISGNNGSAVHTYSDSLSVEITDSEIIDNQGIGITLGSSSSLVMNNTKVCNNTSYGIYCNSDDTEFSISQSMIADNSGAGIYNKWNTEIDHVVIANNGSKGILLIEGFSLLTNSIVYGNNNSNHQQIYLSENATLNTSYSCVEAYSGYGVSELGNYYWGQGSIEDYPQFVDDQYHLSPNSPCIDGGFPWEHDANMPYGLGTVISDMGVYGGPNNGIFGGNPIPNGMPSIDNIVDLPNDQGGVVGIQFNGSIFDYDHSGYDITHYSFWREMNLDSRDVDSKSFETLSKSKRIAPRVLTRDGQYWEYIGQVQAQGFENYGYTAETLADSTIYGDFTSTFIVIAHTQDDDIFFTSAPASGSSIDNLAPDMPSRVLADGAYGQISFEWSPSVAQDLHFYKLYRGLEPNSWDLSYEINDTLFVDAQADFNNQYYYCLKAVDIHGNESPGQDLSLELNYSAYDLQPGANLVSFRFIDVDSSLENMFAELGTSLVKVIGEGQVAIQNESGDWMGSLTDIAYDKGYWLIMDSSERLELMGERATNIPTYSLHSNANLISYPYAWDNDLASALPDDVEENISAIIGEGQACMKLEDGTWIGNLTHFAKEKAYWVIANQDVDLIFNQPNQNREFEQENVELPDFFTYNQSTNQAFFLTGNIDIPGLELTSDDFIAIYKNDICLGASNYQGQNTTIPAMGNDGNALTTNYALEGDLVTIKIWDSSCNQMFDSNLELIWHNNALERVEIGSLTENEDNLVAPNINFVGQNYPNPFNPQTTINFGLKKDNHVRIDVYNLKGQKVKTLLNKRMEAGYHHVVFEAIDYASGYYLYKIVTPDFSETKSMILMK